MFEMVLMNSLMIFGARFALKEGLFSPLTDAYEIFAAKSWLLQWFYQPIWGCVVCMASVWGVIFLLLFGSFPVLSFQTVAHIAMVAGFNLLITTIILKEEV